MTIDGSQVSTSVFGIPTDVDAWFRSNTVGLRGSTPSIVATWGQQGELERTEDGFRGALESPVEVDAAVRIVDRGPRAVPRYCPEGRSATRSS